MPCVPVPQVEIAVRAFSRRCGGREAGQRDVGAFHAARFAFSVRPCDSVGAFCPRFTLGIAFLMQRFSSAYARLCGSGDTSRLGSRLSFFLCQEKRDGLRCLAFLFRRSRSPFVRSRGVAGARGLDGVTWVLFTRRGLRSVCGIALLSQRFDFGLRPALRFCCSIFSRHMPGSAVLSTRLASVHACCLSCAKQDGLRYLAFLFRRSRSPFVRSRGVGAVICLGGFTSGLAVSLWRSRRGYRGRGNAGNGRTGLRGWRRGTCALLRRHIGSVSLSAGSTLGLRAPNLRQRVFDSLDSLHAAAGLRWCVYAPSPGYTERPDRL